MLAGGSDSAVNPIFLAVFEANRADSRSGCCRPFDANRNGVVLGEGAAVLVLEPLSHANARGAKVLATLGGYGQSPDCFDIAKIPKHAPGLQNAIEDCLEDANCPADLIDYINPHATATLSQRSC
ncbi:3-oxoacyl-[acyl-carrier-protein] synthase 2 [BD1-7 clade bacterium]|uniref:3-oxoacyl-[acyl-carrier-protein] synthase 2 n=1 Tax=BD1-7 clade bacterium TaxID=2029982 RepID=A0A5S9N652_9GAMM|nr:3-oxoacyl-[acyl-carrier-protein] synthase 2 [BD1-7 clade bacterium]CAA0085275.1 3-oxoacyl-[acyl-carrier-protein] synthase 2 [BD1-7 clade bacterium]